jgi:hypothetical protein
MNAESGWKAHGMVRVEVQENGYVLNVTMSDLEPGRVNVMHFSAGTCALVDTAVIVDVGRLHADSSGTATLTRLFANTPYSVTAEGRTLAVHGTSGTPAEGGHIACADLTN